jgi:phage/plasmid-like protein (TIGR03299 family)
MDKEQFEQHLISANLNWRVNSKEIQTVDGIKIPDTIALVRDDNNAVLGIHSTGYVPYQNDELLELLYRISQQTGLALHSGGFFKNGEKVWFQLKSDNLTIGQDRVEGFVSGFNSFDGSTSLAFGNANITVSCMNTFWRGYRAVQSKFRHSLSMHERIEGILHNIDIVLEEEKETFQKIRMLSEVKLSQEILDMVTKRMFDLKMEEKIAFEELSTRKINQINQFYVDVNGELNSKDHSLWGLFSGVTKYTTHSMKKGDNSEAKIFGAVGEKERVIFNDLVALV